MRKHTFYIIAVYFLLIGWSRAGFAQKDLRYKDIYPLIAEGKSNEAVPLLQEFLTQEPDHPSANLQLALIYERRYKSYQPITDYDAAMSNAEKAKVRFLKAKVLIDDREVRHNEEYYSNFALEFKRNGKPIVEFDTVQQKFNAGYAEADSFIVHMPPIHKYFMKTVSFYDKATKNFVRINGEYASLKEIYLLFDDKFDQRLSNLKQSYDSALFYFKKYRKAAEAYPPLGLDQQLTIRPIKTYRLDGLVIQTDFLQPHIELWDYAQWADEVRKVEKNNIAALRKEIVEAQRKLERAEQSLTEQNASDSASLQPVKNKTIYKIRRYDINSPIADLFEYRLKKLQLLDDENRLRLMDTLGWKHSDVLLYPLNAVLLEAHRLDPMVQDMLSEYATASLEKYADFVRQYYQGLEGFKAYLNQQASFSKQTLEDAASRLLQALYNVKYKYDSLPDLVYRGIHIPAQPAYTISDSIPENKPITQYRLQNINNTHFLGGFYVGRDGNRRVFLGRSKGADRLIGYDVIDFQQKDGKAQVLKGMALAPGGSVAMLIEEAQKVGTAQNAVQFFDENGKLQNSITLPVGWEPKELVSVEGSNQLLAVLQDRNSGTQQVKLARMFPDSTTFTGRDFQIAGEYAGLYQSGDAFILVSKGAEEKQWQLTKISGSGNVEQQRTFIFKEPAPLRFFTKVSAFNLNAFSERDPEGLPVQVIFNKDLELVYSNVAVEAQN